MKDVKKQSPYREEDMILCYTERLGNEQNEQKQS